MKKVLILLLIAQVSNAQLIPSIYEGVPVFHGANLVGNYPNSDFIFAIPCTGQRPLQFSCTNLPAGLQLDKTTGIITGKTGEVGDLILEISATNSLGAATENLKIIVGEKLCLTPPMGWNSWNVFTKDIDEKMLMQMADAMVQTGMRDVGYQYINIDDYWHDTIRNPDGSPRPDPAKFPHGMKYLADYVHSKGLKLGIYSCAGKMTCGKCFGGYEHEVIDAQTYAQWGIDLLKYDYCFAPWGTGAAVKRYSAMGNALKKSDHSIVFSICEWGLRKPWKWAAQVQGSYYRTTPDIFDTWDGGNLWQMSLMTIVKRNAKLASYAGPGHWNDPDMLLVGNHGDGKATSAGGKYKGLSQEQYKSHFALWCLMKAPLLASCDLRTISKEDLEILTNTKMIDINQNVQVTALQLKKDGGCYVGEMEFSKTGKNLILFNPTEKVQSVGETMLNPYEVLLTKKISQP